MKITVVVCTYNRCQSLATTLDGVAAQVLPEFVEWEVLVVDNNSGDPRRLPLPKQGSSDVVTR